MSMTMEMGTGTWMLGAWMMIKSRYYLDYHMEITLQFQVPPPSNFFFFFGLFVIKMIIRRNFRNQRLLFLSMRSSLH
jgi:hypothetical protein